MLVGRNDSPQRILPVTLGWLEVSYILLSLVLDRPLDNKTPTVKINDTTVNAVAKAQTTTGHIIIFPQNAEMRFRNPIIVSGEKQTPLSFETVQ